MSFLSSNLFNLLPVYARLADMSPSSLPSSSPLPVIHIPAATPPQLPSSLSDVQSLHNRLTVVENNIASLPALISSLRSSSTYDGIAASSASKSINAIAGPSGASSSHGHLGQAVAGPSRTSAASVAAGDASAPAELRTGHTGGARMLALAPNGASVIVNLDETTGLWIGDLEGELGREGPRFDLRPVDKAAGASGVSIESSSSSRDRRKAEKERKSKRGREERERREIREGKKTAVATGVEGEGETAAEILARHFGVGLGFMGGGGPSLGTAVAPLSAGLQGESSPDTPDHEDEHDADPYTQLMHELLALFPGEPARDLMLDRLEWLMQKRGVWFIPFRIFRERVVLMTSGAARFPGSSSSAAGPAPAFGPANRKGKGKSSTVVTNSGTGTGTSGSSGTSGFDGSGDTDGGFEWTLAHVASAAAGLALGGAYLVANDRTPPSFTPSHSHYRQPTPTPTPATNPSPSPYYPNTYYTQPPTSASPAPAAPSSSRGTQSYAGHLAHLATLGVQPNTPHALYRLSRLAWSLHEERHGYAALDEDLILAQVLCAGYLVVAHRESRTIVRTRVSGGGNASTTGSTHRSSNNGGRMGETAGGMLSGENASGGESGNGNGKNNGNATSEEEDAYADGGAESEPSLPLSLSPEVPPLVATLVSNARVMGLHVDPDDFAVFGESESSGRNRPVGSVDDSRVGQVKREEDAGAGVGAGEFGMDSAAGRSVVGSSRMSIYRREVRRRLWWQIVWLDWYVFVLSTFFSLRFRCVPLLVGNGFLLSS